MMDADDLWDYSLVNKNNRSWADQVEEEVENDIIKTPLTRSADKKNGNYNSPRFNLSSIRTIKEEPELEDNSLLGFANADAKSIPKVDKLPNFGTKLLETPEKNTIKKEPQEFLQEDISLTGHLDGFQLVSPCKPEPNQINGPLFERRPYATRSTTSPFKKDIKPAPRTPIKTESIKRKLTDSQFKADSVDEMLMPSPSKISKSTPTSVKKENTPYIKREATPKHTPSSLKKEFTRKRLRESLTPKAPRTPRSSRESSSSEKVKREVETDPEIIARRQKQIDYGKNTIGYDRYTQLVPRDARKKIHPKTPPINLKFSRRAWDGLIKVWRQRLHFWDPPSEGGGNPECLEIASDMSDCSSTESSQPNTPVQDMKRVKNLSQRVSKKFSEMNSQIDQQKPEADFENQGCTPLPPD